MLCLSLGAGFVRGQDAAAPDAPVRWQSPALVAAAIADSYVRLAPEPIGPRSYPLGINPLTGLPYPSDEAQDRRNLIVKISNWPPPKVRRRAASIRRTWYMNTRRKAASRVSRPSIATTRRTRSALCAARA